MDRGDYLGLVIPMLVIIVLTITVLRFIQQVRKDRGAQLYWRTLLNRQKTGLSILRIGHFLGQLPGLAGGMSGARSSYSWSEKSLG